MTDRLNLDDCNLFFSIYNYEWLIGISLISYSDACLPSIRSRSRNFQPKFILFYSLTNTTRYIILLLNRYSPFNRIPIKIQGWLGILVKKSKKILVNDNPLLSHIRCPLQNPIWFCMIPFYKNNCSVYSIYYCCLNSLIYISSPHGYNNRL